MRFKRWFGVRHIQVMMFSVLIFLDVYQAETVKKFLSNDKTNNLATGGQFSRLTRAFEIEQIQLIEQIFFLCFALGRTFCSFPIMRLNNKYFLLGLMVVEIICCGLFTYLVEAFQFMSFAVLAGIIFIVQSAHYPLAINIIAKWIPPNEYTRAVVLVAAGDTIARGILTWTLRLSNLTIMNRIFNFTIAFKSIWCVVYMIVGAQDPQTSFLIRKFEWEMLSKEIGPRKRVRCNMKIPWKSILTCPRLYALVFSEIANKWFFLAATSFRNYCPEIKEINDAEIALIFHPLVAFGTAWFMDTMIAKYYISRNNARKIMNTIALWGGALSLAFMCYRYKDPNKVVFYLMLAQYLALLAECSQTASVFDLSPNYAAVMFCLYMIPAWASIVLYTRLRTTFTENSTIRKSLPVYYRAGLVMFVFNYAFLMLGNITLLKFDAYDTDDWRKESVISYP